MINSEQLRSIIELNRKIHDEMETIVRKDLLKYSREGIHIAETVRLIFNETSELIQIPLKDDKIGGMTTKKNNNLYCFINTFQPRVFQNFVYLHEFYHLLYDQKDQFHLISDEIETTIDLQERKANYYASLMLLNKDSLRNSFYYLIDEREFDLRTSVYYLMNLFKTTYKTVLIRLYEINCIKEFDILVDLFTSFNQEDVCTDFKHLGLDTSILEPSNTFSLGNLEEEVERAKRSDALLEDFLKMNLQEFSRVVDRIKKIQEIEDVR